jgi:hypothetical protein
VGVNYNCESHPEKACYYKFKTPILELLETQDMYAKDMVPILNDGLPQIRQCSCAQVTRALIELQWEGLVKGRDTKTKSKIWGIVR